MDFGKENSLIKRRPRFLRSGFLSDEEEFKENNGSNPNLKFLKECCRSLHFDNIQEIQETEEVTTTLDMMDMTAMISGSSILQERVFQQDKYHMQNKSVVELKQGSCRQNYGSLTKEHFTFGAQELERELLNADYNLRNKIKAKTTTSRILERNMKTKKSVPVKLNLNGKPHGKEKKIRSAFRSLKQTPKPLINKDVKIRNSKYGKFSASKLSQSQIQKNVKESHSNIKKNKKMSVPTKVAKLVISLPEPEIVDDFKSVKMCNASTNTEILYSLERSLDKDLMKATDKLLEEQEEINRKANHIREQTTARRQKMKDSRILEKFITSVSPLKRLHEMIRERSSLDVYAISRCSDSPQVAEMTDGDNHCKERPVYFEDSDMEVSTPENTVQNESIMDCSLHNTTTNLNSNHLKRQHLRVNSRMFQTPSSHPNEPLKKGSPAHEEIFHSKIEEDLSPFTKMAGDCDRPSLAPMTPHSRHQVSLIKMSIRKQLDLLYES